LKKVGPEEKCKRGISNGFRSEGVNQLVVKSENDLLRKKPKRVPLCIPGREDQCKRDPRGVDATKQAQE